MNTCKDCAEWSRDESNSGELDATMPDLGVWKTPLELGYGRCTVAKESAPMIAKYDGGYTGELLTHMTFGCNQFKWRPL